MAWDSWEESQRKRAEADRRERERRLADDRRRADQERAKERKKRELKEKAEREEKKQRQLKEANAVYEEAINGPENKEKKKPSVSLNKFGGMRAFGFSNGGQQSSGSAQPRPPVSQKGEGGVTPLGGPGAKSSGGGGSGLMTGAWLSGSRRFR